MSLGSSFKDWKTLDEILLFSTKVVREVQEAFISSLKKRIAVPEQNVD